jgi:hypothetical protein
MRRRIRKLYDDSKLLSEASILRGGSTSIEYGVLACAVGLVVLSWANSGLSPGLAYDRATLLIGMISNNDIGQRDGRGG